MFDYDQVEHAIEEGYLETWNKLNDIKMMLESLGEDSKKV